MADYVSVAPTGLLPACTTLYDTQEKANMWTTRHGYFVLRLDCHSTIEILLVVKKQPHLQRITIFGRPSVKRFAQCHQDVVCLSLTLVYCGQMVGWIKIKLGMEVGLGLGHTVLNGDPAPLPKSGTARPHCRPTSLVVKWLDGLRCYLVLR